MMSLGWSLSEAGDQRLDSHWDSYLSRRDVIGVPHPRNQDTADLAGKDVVTFSQIRCYAYRPSIALRLCATLEGRL